MKPSIKLLLPWLLLALSLGGCGDKEKAEAKEKWQRFKTKEIAAIQATFGETDQKPVDFYDRIVEVQGLAFRFKGLITYQAGHTFHEQAYVFSDGNWIPVARKDAKSHVSVAKAQETVTAPDKKTLHETQKEIEKIEKKIEVLKKDIGVEGTDIPADEQPLPEEETKKKAPKSPKYDHEEEWP